MQNVCKALQIIFAQSLQNTSLEMIVPNLLTYSFSASKVIVLIFLIIVWNFVYFQDAYKEFQSKSITTITRTMKIENLEYPAVTICSNTGFKPSFQKQDNDTYPFGHENIYDNNSVLDVFLNQTYGNALRFVYKIPQ